MIGTGVVGASIAFHLARAGAGGRASGRRRAPLRVGPLVRTACAVLELPAGTLARTGTVEGDRITVE